MNKIFVTLIFTSLSFLAFSQSNNKILGEWYTADKKAVVTIFSEGKTILLNILEVKGGTKNNEKSIKK